MSKKLLSHSRHGLLILVILSILIPIGSIHAQYSDMDLEMSAAERDSLVEAYDNVFPFLGRKVIEKGLRLPAPVGINVNYFVGEQGIEISNMGLGINDGDMVDVSDVIVFENSLSKVENINLRADLWVFPFFNVYGIFGHSWATTSVNLEEPISLQSQAEMNGPSNGVGFTAATGLQGFWFAVDNNWVWSNFDVLEKSVRTRTLGVRFGKAFRWGDKSTTAWVGAMRVDLESGTQGTVVLSDVIPEVPPEFGERFQDWYDELTELQKLLIDQFLERLEDVDLGSTRVNYSLDKQPTSPWTMNVGGQIEFSRNWQIRGEVNFMGSRTSILANLVYRFDI